MQTTKKKYRQEAAGAAGGHPGKDISEKQGAEEQPDESCRCKEVSKKTFPGMLRLMLNDLAFWKKGKQRK